MQPPNGPQTHFASHARVRVSPLPTQPAGFDSEAPGTHSPSPAHVPVTHWHELVQVSVCFPHFPQGLVRVAPAVHSAAGTSSQGFHGFQVPVAPQARNCVPQIPQARFSSSPALHSVGAASVSAAESSLLSAMASAVESATSPVHPKAIAVNTKTVRGEPTRIASSMADAVDHGQ
jgi:hypothetical protein